jgi:hypothetical protein
LTVFDLQILALFEGRIFEKGKVTSTQPGSSLPKFYASLVEADRSRLTASRLVVQVSHPPPSATLRAAWVHKATSA